MEDKFVRLYPYLGESEMQKEFLIDQFRRFLEDPLNYADGTFLIVCKQSKKRECYNRFAQTSTDIQKEILDKVYN